MNLKKDSIDLFKKLFNSINDAIIVADTDTKEIIYFNRASLDLFGISEKKLIESSFSSLHSDIDDTFLKKEVLCHENEIISKNSKKIPVLISSSIIEHENRRITQCVYKNISKIKENELKLKEFIEFMPETIFETDKAGRIVNVNQNAKTKFRYSDDDISNGLHMLELLIPEDRERAARNAAEVIKGKILGDNEYTALRKDGTTFPVLIHSTSIIKNDEVEGLQGIAIEISSRKHTENKILEREKSLSLRNEEIKRELEYARIIQEAYLPDIPKSDMLSIGYSYLPMENIGGDYISITNVKEVEGLGIFIGDVTGHGIPAALFTSLLNKETNRICRNYGSIPKNYITELNKELAEASMNFNFVTGTYALFQRAKNSTKTKLTFSNAGHPPPILFKKNSTPEMIKTKGRLLGYDKDSEYKETKIILEKGDRIFLYTDGITEARNDVNEMLEEEGFMEMIYKIGQEEKDITNTVKDIIDSHNNFLGRGIIEDDRVLMGIEIK